LDFNTIWYFYCHFGIFMAILPSAIFPFWFLYQKMATLVRRQSDEAKSFDTFQMQRTELKKSCNCPHLLEALPLGRPAVDGPDVEVRVGEDVGDLGSML
jgi:hypothetical protein